MVDLSEIQAAYYMVAATGVLVAAIYYILNMKATLQTRQAQLFMQMFQAQYTPEFINLQDQALFHRENDKLLSGSSLGGDVPFLSVLKYYEGIAVLVKKQLLDVDLVYELNPTLISSFWLKFEPAIRRYRAERNYPQFAHNLEFIGELMIAEAKKRGEPTGITYFSESQ